MLRFARKTVLGLLGLGLALGVAETAAAQITCAKTGDDFVAIIDVQNDDTPANWCGGIGTTEISFEVYLISGGCSAASGLFVRCQDDTTAVNAFLCNRIHSVRPTAPFPWGLPGGPSGGCAHIEYSD